MGGGRSLGVRTLQWLSMQEEFEVVAVCPVPYELDHKYHGELMKVVEENHLNVCDISEIKNMDVELGLSVNYHKIIGEDILDHCSKGFYNVHHSYNLRLRGRNISTFAILNTLNENVFYHGTTIHKMSPKLDAGSIAASRSVGINEEDTAYSLFKKADNEAFMMIKEWLPRIAFERVFLYEPPEDGVHYYRNSDLPDRRLDTSSMSDTQINTYVRAFDFPGFEPAYLEENGVKIHLVFKSRDVYQHQYNLKDHIYYTN